MRLAEIQTPALILDKQRLENNVSLMTELVKSRGVRLRPHLKTCKSIDVARIALRGNFGGITVATLNEAEYFASHGITDILYGVCFTPDKMARARALQERGVKMTLIVDSIDVAKALETEPAGPEPMLRVMVEVDCGEGRTGVTPHDPSLLQIASILNAAQGIEFAGVFTHAGHSYQCRTISEIEKVAEDERLAVVSAAENLMSIGIHCDDLSVGSTPTAMHATAVDQITEVRAGVYMFHDLFQAALQSCQVDDIAVSVLATVISHDRRRNRLIIDAGGLALSKDRSTASTDQDAGYGRLMDVTGDLLAGDLCVCDTHQEHGEVTSNSPLPFEALPIGSRVRVLPNHSCMTAAMYDCYHVIGADVDDQAIIWPRTNGWQQYLTGKLTG